MEVNIGHGMDSIKSKLVCHFVSWCANESGMLDDSSVPKFSLCTDGENWYKKNNRWKDKTYVPMTGNIIFLIGNRMVIQIM